MNIKVVNYKTGNISSVVSALDTLGVKSTVVSDVSSINSGDTILFPGVGSFDRAAQNLRSGGFYDHNYEIEENKVIGICLGFHLMCQNSEEGKLPGLNLFKSKVLDLNNRVEPFLNLGWFKVDSNLPAFSNSHYFCHRYFVPSQLNTIAHIERSGHIISNVVNEGKYWGIQSHPERSGVAGLRLLEEVIYHES